MSGNGHIIIRSALKAALSDPLIHGKLTLKMQQSLDCIFTKEEGEWNEADDLYVTHAAGWALKNT